VNLPGSESVRSYSSQASLSSEPLSQPMCIQLSSKELLALAGWGDRVRSWGWLVTADAETGSCRISRLPVVLNKPLGVSDLRCAPMPLLASDARRYLHTWESTRSTIIVRSSDQLRGLSEALLG
jgi:hypothetical protein